MQKITEIQNFTSFFLTYLLSDLHVIVTVLFEMFVLILCIYDCSIRELFYVVK